MNYSLLYIFGSSNQVYLFYFSILKNLHEILIFKLNIPISQVDSDNFL